MTAVEVFQFPATGQQIRTVIRDGSPWFVATDICGVLAVGNVTDAVRSLDDDEYEVVPAALVTTEGRPQDLLNLVTEAGLYSLILRSRKPEAKAFKRWVTHEVLPAIRQTGRYEVAQLDELEVARRYVLTLEAKRALESKVAELEPSAEAWNTLASADGDYSVREAAFVLNRDRSIQIGQNRLFNLLREWRLIDLRDIPYAAHETHVRLRTRSYPHPQTGEEMPAKPQVRITAAGLRYLHRRMGGTEPLAA